MHLQQVPPYPELYIIYVVSSIVSVAVGGGEGGLGGGSQQHNTLECVITLLILEHSGHLWWLYYPSGDPIIFTLIMLTSTSPHL